MSQSIKWRLPYSSLPHNKLSIGPKCVRYTEVLLKFSLTPDKAVLIILEGIYKSPPTCSSHSHYKKKLGAINTS